ncbi:DNA methylase N-4/N-6 domain-containing protein [Salinisphaera dokdonensis CL-ES53]|uniref:site-specific DNA-methyltransferase (adenine-specific) n=1 Tax=Salinisphaera dokdonensis CL-ES53 TaxID=1304272 RepID=A0ABV2AZ31_9GAMM
MPKNKTKLELTWIGKDQRPRLEPRILLEDPEKSYHANERVSDQDIFDNRLIFGDNLLALKALEQEFAGKVKCVFIDPPYNTGSAFEHYDDGIEHSLWLSMMRDRLEIIRNLLSNDGSLWITIDDNEGHYLKVLCDEIFGRAAYLGSAVWENFYGRSNAAAISPAHNYVQIYAPLGNDWKRVRNLLPRDEKSSSKYKNPDKDPRGPWRAGPIFAPGERHEGLMYEIKTPSGRSVKPPRGSHWRMVEAEFKKLFDDGRILFGKDGNNTPAIKLFLNEVQSGLVPRTWWPHTEVGHSQEGKREAQALFDEGNLFDTPKPERLIERIINIATNPGEIILDSFAGSGTTGAVAHKMGRRWIMVELGEHCQTYILPRLKQVIDGTDAGGITQSIKWQGGGGFRYYRLAPSLLTKDKWDNWVISPDYDAAMLAQAMCKHEGFTYAPDPETWWNQGHATEKDFIYVTTQTLTHEQLSAIHQELDADQSLLICCSAFRADPDAFERITLKKIPHAVLGQCEFGRDDYSLEVANLPDAAPDAGSVDDLFVGDDA